MFIAGHVIQGLCTSLLLIAAVPPLAIGYPANKLRDTAVIMNMCIFGAVALGPFIGGLQAESNAWRPLFWIVAGISVAALVLARADLRGRAAGQPRLAARPAGDRARGGRLRGRLLRRLGAHEPPLPRPVVIVPLLGGLAAIVVLVVYQYRAKRPLLTIRTMLTSSIPVAGIVVALFAAAASVSATALTAGVLAGRYSPLHIGLLYLPEVAGAVITAIALGLVITKRAMHYLPLVGMLFLAAGIAVFRIEVPPSQAPTLVGSGLTGIGLGRDRRAGAVRRRLLAAVRQPAARVRDRRAASRGRRVHGRADLRPLRGDRRRQPGRRHGDRALDRPRARDRRRGDRRRSLRARRRPPAGARPRRFLAGQRPAWYSPPLLAKLRGRMVTAQQYVHLLDSSYCCAVTMRPRTFASSGGEYQAGSSPSRNPVEVGFLRPGPTERIDGHPEHRAGDGEAEPSHRAIPVPAGLMPPSPRSGRRSARP